MKKFISILIALFAILTIQAQQYSLDNSSSSNVCVVQQHIDVGVAIQPIVYSNIYISSVPASAYYMPSATTITITNNPISYYTSYTEQYRRGVGLINTYSNYNYIQTNNLIDVTDNGAAKKYCWMNIQKYYCN